MTDQPQSIDEVKRQEIGHALAALHAVAERPENSWIRILGWLWDVAVEVGRKLERKGR